MRIRLLTLRLDPDAATFDEALLTRELEGEKVLGVEPHVIPHPDGALLALVVTCDDAEPQARAEPTAPPRRFDAARDVPQPLRACYEALRTWRNTQAASEEVPGYRVLTNRQLAALAALRPRTVAELSEVPGIGDTRLARYGDALLELLQPWTER